MLADSDRPRDLFDVPLETGGVAQPADLFDVPPGTVRAWRSSQPPMLPEERPAVRDVFDVSDSPTVGELLRLADKRLEPTAERPVVVGMCCNGVIANYDEAYRLSLKTGKPLRVLVGQTMDFIVKQGLRDDGFLKVRVDDGADGRFPITGCFEYEPRNGQLWQKTGQRSATWAPDANRAESQSAETQRREHAAQPTASFAVPVLNWQPRPVQFYSPNYQPMTNYGSFGYSASCYGGS